MTAADRTATEELLIGTLLAQQTTSRPHGLSPDDCTGPRRAALEAMAAGWETGTAPDVGVVALAAGLPVSTLMAWQIEATESTTTVAPLVSLLHRERLRGLFRPAAEALQRLAAQGEPGHLEATVATLARSGALDVLGELTGAAPGWPDQLTSLLNGAGPEPAAVTLHQLLARPIPVRAPLLEPILREKETAMIHAWRGVGKTHVGLGIAFAIATGGSFLRWHAPTARRVLYLDGEMPGRTMQERLAALVTASGLEDVPADTFRLICADLQPRPLPNLATPEGQAFVAPWVALADVVIVDSIATLASVGDMNASESWLPLQAWALSCRRQGKSVVFLHHDAKGGETQRGTSAREDILDTVLHLRRPGDYRPEQGARFEVHVTKNRGHLGGAAIPFEAALEVVDGQAVWTTRTLEDVQLARAAALYRDGAKPRDVAADLKVHVATAYRLRQKATEAGLL